MNRSRSRRVANLMSRHHIVENPSAGTGIFRLSGKGTRTRADQLTDRNGFVD
jgi:hypothetical protein